MKKIQFYILTLLVLTSFVACDKEEDDKLTGGAATGGLIDVKSQLVTYVLNNGNDYPYTASLRLFQGDVKVTKISIYKSFTNEDNDTSNEVLLKTIDVPNSPQDQTLSFTTTFNELIDGLILNGNPLPTSDSGLKIGEFWRLRYVTTTSDGNEHSNSKFTKLAIGTRFAGKYTVVESSYWRINVFSGDWNGDERIIESVDETTYRYVGYAGPFASATNTHYFTIDNSDLVNTPGSYNGSVQLLNGFGVINCTDNPTDMINSCNFAGPQNTVVRDNIDGKDRIYRTYGYYTTGSGPREFYEVLEKVVD